MKRYSNYFEFTFLEKLKIFQYERENLVKVYATNSLEDMVSNLDKVKYSQSNSIEIYFDSRLKVSPSKKIHKEIRKLRMFPNLDFKLPVVDFDFDWTHLLGDFYNFPFENNLELGIDFFLYEDLLKIKEKTGFCYLKNGYFRHFKNHIYPELIDFSNNGPNRKRKIKTHNKVFLPPILSPINN